MTVKIAYFARAHPDIACGNVGIRADMPIEFGHEALAKSHHFAVGFAFGIEVGAAFGSADGKPRKTVFKDLFKPQKFDDGQIDGGMEAKPALIRTDGAVELYAVALIDMYPSLVVDPRNAENDGALRFDKTFEESCFFVFGMTGKYGFESKQDFRRRLMKFRFAWIAFFELCQNLFYVSHTIFSLKICLSDSIN